MIIDENLELEEEGEGWVEISRLEFLARLENVLTVDLMAFEIERTASETPVGRVESYTWIKLDEFDQQLPMFLCVRDLSRVDGKGRWFIHQDLIEDLPG